MLNIGLSQATNNEVYQYGSLLIVWHDEDTYFICRARDTEEALMTFYRFTR